jgi:hypothetical protein
MVNYALATLSANQARASSGEVWVDNNARDGITNFGIDTPRTPVKRLFVTYIAQNFPEATSPATTSA